MTKEGLGYLFIKKDYSVFGISHKELAIDDRQVYALSVDQQNSLLQEAQKEGCPFVMILSTCNRTEFFIEGDFIDSFKNLLGNRNKDWNEISHLVYTLSGKEAVDHTFSVAAGLESQIPGDFEIIGQMRKAFNRSKSIFQSSAFFERLMNTVTHVSKRVKNETGFSSGVTSTAYAAVKCIRENYPNIKDEKVLIYGTGKIGANVCENLVKHVPKENIRIINRSIEKAEVLSERYGLKCLSEEHLEESLNLSDVIVVATGASQPTVREEMIKNKGSKFLIDLSLPRNVDIALYNSERVLDVDELSRKNNETVQHRLLEVPKVEAIVQENKMKFFEWMDNRKYAPTMSAIQQKLNKVKSKELQKTPFGKEQFNKEEVEELTNTIIKKIAGSFYGKIQNMNSSELDLVHQLFDDQK